MHGRRKLGQREDGQVRMKSFTARTAFFSVSGLGGGDGIAARRSAMESPRLILSAHGPSGFQPLRRGTFVVAMV